MKKKIIGIFISMLVITTTITVSSMKEKDTTPSEQSKLILSIDIIEPKAGWFYLMGNPVVNIASLSRAVIIGPITFKVNITSELPIECVDWYVDGNFEEQIAGAPYDWYWPMVSGFAGSHEVRVEIIDDQSNTDDDIVKVFKIL